MKKSVKTILTSATAFILIISSLLLSGCATTGKPDANGSEKESENGGSEAVTTTKKPDIVFPETIDFDDEQAILTIFDMSDILDGVTAKVNKKSKSITMKASVNGTNFTFTVGLTKWAGYTSPEQIVTCSKLFWYCYPQMFARLANDGSPTSVFLNFENEGYEVASAGGNAVHIHDQWLHDHPSDFDCLTHEFAHVIQGGWNGNFSPAYEGDTYMIERFADYCRYIYAFDKGRYNDFGWDLQTASTENTYYKSVRLWVWIDYTYSTDKIDIMKRINKYVQAGDRSAISKNWGTDGPMWDKVFKGTEAEGKTITELWDLYTASSFSKLSTKPRKVGDRSALEREFDVRKTIKGRAGDVASYVNLK